MISNTRVSRAAYSAGCFFIAAVAAAFVTVNASTRITTDVALQGKLTIAAAISVAIICASVALIKGMRTVNVTKWAEKQIYCYFGFAFMTAYTLVQLGVESTPAVLAALVSMVLAAFSLEATRRF